jgi:hypothetical protein
VSSRQDYARAIAEAIDFRPVGRIRKQDFQTAVVFGTAVILLKSPNEQIS